MNKAILYIMIGAPGSGKSTWAKTHFPKEIYVSRDECRYSLIKEEDDYFSREREVFSLFCNKIAESLRVNKKAIADATHLNSRSRYKLIRELTHICKENIPFDIICVYMKANFETCFARNNARTGRECVPAGMLEEMYDAIEEPSMLEDPRMKEIWTIQA